MGLGGGWVGGCMGFGWVGVWVLGGWVVGCLGGCVLGSGGLYLKEVG